MILIFSENQFCFLMCTPCNIEGNRSMAQPCAVSLESPARSAFRQIGCGLQQTSPKTVECFDAGLLPVQSRHPICRKCKVRPMALTFKTIYTFIPEE